MKPKRISWNIGIVSAVIIVARSRRMWRNSFWKTARNELQIDRMPFIARPSPGLRRRARCRRLFGQRDEHVFQRGRDVADHRALEAGALHAREQLGVAHLLVDDGVDGLAEDGGADGERL